MDPRNKRSSKLLVTNSRFEGREEFEEVRFVSILNCNYDLSVFIYSSAFELFNSDEVLFGMVSIFPISVNFYCSRI